MIVDCVLSYGTDMEGRHVSVTEKEPYPGAEAWDVYRLTVPEELQPHMKDGHPAVFLGQKEALLFDVLTVRKGRPLVVWQAEDGTENTVALIETPRPPQEPYRKMIWEVQ